MSAYRVISHDPVYGSHRIGPRARSRAYHGHGSAMTSGRVRSYTLGTARHTDEPVPGRVSWAAVAVIPRSLLSGLAGLSGLRRGGRGGCEGAPPGRRGNGLGDARWDRPRGVGGGWAEHRSLARVPSRIGWAARTDRVSPGAV